MGGVRLYINGSYPDYLLRMKMAIDGISEIIPKLTKHSSLYLLTKTSSFLTSGENKSKLEGIAKDSKKHIKRIFRNY